MQRNLTHVDGNIYSPLLPAKTFFFQASMTLLSVLKRSFSDTAASNNYRLMTLTQEKHWQGNFYFKLRGHKCKGFSVLASFPTEPLSIGGFRVFILCFDPSLQQRIAVDFSEEPARHQVRRRCLFCPRRISLVSSLICCDSVNAFLETISSKNTGQNNKTSTEKYLKINSGIERLRSFVPSFS